jgi:hypothetical protein
MLRIHTFAALVSFNFRLLGDTVRCRMINIDGVLGAVLGLGQSSWRRKMSVTLILKIP